MNEAIIDEPGGLGYDLVVSEAWVVELEALKADGVNVGLYMPRAIEMLAQAREFAAIEP